jgi:poly-gamma-glutamate synthesis protein (capsule biosynthesis protein)
MPVLALSGDTKLGRGVGEHLSSHPARSVFGQELLEVLSGTDGMLLNLECCLSDRGRPWPGRVFHFRGPPSAVDALTLLGVRCVSLANNHALDFGEPALLDTLQHLHAAGIAVVGAGADRHAARRPAVLAVGGLDVTVVAFTDHPAEYAARTHRPGVAYADVQQALPEWLTTSLDKASHAPLLVFPHWGPNMTRRPLPYVRRAASDLVEAGATLVAGHSAHVFHGVTDHVLFDLGDFLDDYAVDRELRNDMGLLWLVELSPDGPRRIRALPLVLEYCFTRRASAAESDWIERRLRHLCAPFGTDVEHSGGLIEVRLGPRPKREAWR